MPFPVDDVTKGDRELTLGKVGSEATTRALASIASGVGLELRSVTINQLPDASEHRGTIVHCSDGDGGGPCLTFSDGTKWVKVKLGVEVGTPDENEQ